MMASDSTYHQLAGGRIVILGLARQGEALARWLAGQGADVVISDLRPADALGGHYDHLQDLGIAFVLGEHPLGLLEGTDLLCLSGGVPLSAPIVEEAVKRGIPLTNDAQLFLERCPCRVAGITGSAGKTTTTALTGAICEAAGLKTWVGGNIGHVLIDDLNAISPDDVVIMELSSFQLELMTVSPHVGAVLNITPNHLDRHGTMAAYTAAKANIIAHQDSGDIAVLGVDDEGAASLEPLAPGRVHAFSMRGRVTNGAYLDGGQLILARDNRTEIIVRREAIRLRGDHNVLNVLAACAIAGALGVGLPAMRTSIESFEGIPHRLEHVTAAGGVTWVNDSIATSPERVIAALNSYDEPVVLLLGGRDKKLPWDELARRIVSGVAEGQIRRVIAFGEIRPLVADALNRAGGIGDRFEQSEDLPAAVNAAESAARPGDVVLLSPGGTSFDAYKDFEARGEHFRALVDGQEEG
jgi:UDP-N-acetylmuramoylalanine--D-glutamate ligase